MPQAKQTHTRNPSSTAALFAAVGIIVPGDPGVSPVAPPDRNRPLSAACHAALVTQEALATLTSFVADLPPNDPRHSAVYTMAEAMKARWEIQVAKACRIPAAGAAAFQTKAALLGRMVERDEADQVVGSPAVQLAASLANDLLAYEGWDAGG